MQGKTRPTNEPTYLLLQRKTVILSKS